MAKNDLGYIMSPTSGRYANQYLLHPATTGVPAVGIPLTSGAGAWGAYADIIAAAAALAELLICGFYVDTLGAVQIFEVQVADATPTVISEFRLDPTAVTANLGFLPVGAFPVYAAAAAQIQGRAGGAAAKVIGVSILYTVG